MKNFCDFCDCDECKFGADYDWFLHAQTNEPDKWICSTCYTYDLCTSGPNRANHPCENKECIHRPKLVTKWSK